jgi:hypothetical protein
MTETIDLSEYRRRGAGKRRMFFDQTELRRLLDVYSRRVMTGEWRDYAIDFNGPIATFSIFRNTHERPVYAVAKRRNGKHTEYFVHDGARVVKRGRELPEVLKVLEKPLRLVKG